MKNLFKNQFFYVCLMFIGAYLADTTPYFISAFVLIIFGLAGFVLCKIDQHINQ